MGLLFALSLPGLVCLLVVLVAVERLGRLGTVRRRLPWLRGRNDANQAPLAATSLTELHALLSGAKRAEVEAHAAHSLLRDEEHDGAPPLITIDLDGRTARIGTPRPDGPGRRR